MKTAVVYYSMSGNCEYTAKKIAKAMDADLIRLEPVKAYPDSGAVMGEAPALKPYHFEAPAYDRIIFGFPVWAANPTPPIRTFIRENEDKLRGKKFAAFACQSGNGAEKALSKLKKMLNADSLEAELILIDPMEKPAPEKDQAIAGFCSKLG